MKDALEIVLAFPCPHGCNEEDAGRPGEMCLVATMTDGGYVHVARVRAALSAGRAVLSSGIEALRCAPVDAATEDGDRRTEGEAMNNEREVDPDEDPELALETVEELQVALAMAVTERDAARRDLAALQAQLAVANDLLNDWEASATIESPPALAYRTSKYLHPEAYLASQPPSSLGALETCPTCGDHVPLEASGAEHRRRCSPRGTGLDPATVDACVAAIARRGAGGTRAYAADYIECIRGLVGTP